MMIPDLINGSVELVGAFFTFKNALTLYRAKKLAGVYWPSTLFFTLWGLWNLYFYPALGQWASFTGGAILVIGNICWVTLAIYYLFFKKHKFTFTEEDLKLDLEHYSERYIQPAIESIQREFEKVYCIPNKKRASKVRKIGSKRKETTAKPKKKNNGNASKHRKRWIRQIDSGGYYQSCI